MQLLGIIAVALGDLAVIGGALMWGWRNTAGLRLMGEDWQGEPERRGPGGALIAPARPSVMERIAVLEVGLADVKAELHPNGGTSTRDAINRLEQLIVQMQRDLRQQRAAAAPTIEAAPGLVAERAEVMADAEGGVRYGFKR